MTRAVLTPRAVWCRARATAGLTKLCQLLALSAWHGIAQERSAGSSIKQISALTHFASAQSPAPARTGPQARKACHAHCGHWERARRRQARGARERKQRPGG